MPGKRTIPAPAPAPRRVVIANRYPGLSYPRGAVERVIHLLDAAPGVIGLPGATLPRGELSLAFLTDPALAQLHADFLDDPSTTDVITFEGEQGPGLPEEAISAGEVCVSVDTAVAYAREHGHDFATELTLYLVHGWLHLAGHDDLVPAKKRAMRRAEARALAVLRAANAIPAFVLAKRRQRPAVRVGAAGRARVR